FQVLVLENQANIITQLTELRKIVVATSATKVAVALPPDAPTLPASTYDGLKEVNAYAASQDKLDVLVQHLALIGGNDEKDTTRRILCALVKHDLALRLSWCGSGGKKEAFGDLQNLRTVVLHAVRSTCSMATKTSVETTMKSWLVAAPDRNGGRSKRRAADQQPTSATRQPLHGALPMALYQPNDRHGATLDHCCSADGTIPAQRSALCRPWPLVFCRCHDLG
ncbi:uncharacterized protein LOC120850221, partial [Ixodes scapularis]|uniref:uncharacterized protein LOC120850221 n=1 Tax=Ixodes scapularis TaxID=6945 RepID=UPI001C38E442